MIPSAMERNKMGKENKECWGGAEIISGATWEGFIWGRSEEVREKERKIADIKQEWTGYFKEPREGQSS